MAKLLRKNIKLDGKVKFDLSFISGLTVIFGDSASGRTFFYKRFKEKCLLEEDMNFVFINKDTLSSGIGIESLLGVRNKVIIIDNADVILPDDIGTHIFEDKYNQYIIMARDIAKYSAGVREIALLEEKDNVISLKYPYMQKRWLKEWED